MDYLLLRIAVNMFDPVGVIIPGFVISALFRKHRFAWIWTGVLVAAWKGGTSFLVDPEATVLMLLAGLLGGIVWAWVFRLFQMKRQPPSDN